MGLYDAPDEAIVRRGLSAAGLTSALEPDGLLELGPPPVLTDLEDELIRALGLEGVEP